MSYAWLKCHGLACGVIAEFEPLPHRGTAEPICSVHEALMLLKQLLATISLLIVKFVLQRVTNGCAASSHVCRPCRCPPVFAESVAF